MTAILADKYKTHHATDRMPDKDRLCKDLLAAEIPLAHQAYVALTLYATFPECLNLHQRFLLSLCT